MPTTLERLDEHLKRSDHDSQDWADGLGAELAAEGLAQLTQREWSALEHMVQSRAPSWKARLASVLRPQFGEFAGRLLLQLSADSDIEVAFLAMRGVAFYCGVNNSSDDPFVDARLAVPEFLQMAKESEGLTERIYAVGAQCHPLFRRELALLEGVLSGGA